MTAPLLITGTATIGLYLVVDLVRHLLDGTSVLLIP